MKRKGSVGAYGIVQNETTKTTKPVYLAVFDITIGLYWTMPEEYVAEREGFEPPIALRLWLISSQLHSTGLCHLSAR